MFGQLWRASRKQYNRYVAVLSDCENYVIQLAADYQASSNKEIIYPRVFAYGADFFHVIEGDFVGINKHCERFLPFRLLLYKRIINAYRHQLIIGKKTKVHKVFDNCSLLDRYSIFQTWPKIFFNFKGYLQPEKKQMQCGPEQFIFPRLFSTSCAYFKSGKLKTQRYFRLPQSKKRCSSKHLKKPGKRHGLRDQQHSRFKNFFWYGKQ